MNPPISKVQRRLRIPPNLHSSSVSDAAVNPGFASCGFSGLFWIFLCAG